MAKFTRAELNKGMVIVYLLGSEQRPVHPEKEWRGRIMEFYLFFDAVEVEVLIEGYEGFQERVHFRQIVRVEND